MVLPPWSPGDVDDLCVAVEVCEECDGTGLVQPDGVAFGMDDDAEDTEGEPLDCPVCCGQGRLDP